MWDIPKTFYINSLVEKQGCKLVGILFKYNAFSYLSNIDLEQSIDIITDIVDQEFEERVFKSFLADNIFTDKKCNYEEYKEAIGIEVKQNVKKIDINERRNHALNNIKAIHRRRLKGGNN